MSAGLRDRIHTILPDMVALRHNLHQHPELSDHEEWIAALVAERLRSLGLEVQTGVGGHGVVAELSGAQPGPTLALRADMDALPIQETGSQEYCSQNAGVMHACGHDGHTTILLGAATILSSQCDSLNGSLRFLFQPAEENVSGARRMVAAGAMEGVDAVVALHGWPQIGLGKIGLRTGPIMASADTFDLIVKGTGAHAAYPHLSFDPIVTAAQIVLALQTLASRETDPNDPLVVTVAQFNAGTAYNIIPGEARLSGTVRTLSPDTRAGMPERIRRIAEGICAASRATCDFLWHEGAPPVMNDEGVTALIAEAGEEVVGSGGVVTVPYPSMGAEDFAFMLQKAPGAMFRLGLGDTAPIHTPTFDFDDRALPIGVEMFCRIARKYLGGDEK